VFHDLPTNVVGSTFVVVGDTNRIGSLEHQSYLSAVQAELERRQLRYIRVPDSADWLVVLHYWDYPVHKMTGSRPVVGQVAGGGYTRHQGTVSHLGTEATYTGSSHTSPQYGVVGYQTTEDYWFAWGLRIEFYDGAAYRSDLVTQRYDARCTGISKGGSRDEAIPVMIREVFRDFPGKAKQRRERKVSY